MTVDFNDYFWGEKNNGFDVLYHNMKFGLVASKELSEFFREKSSIEEHNSKLMTKLANKAGPGQLNGTFAPIWILLRQSAEKISTLHLQMVQKLTELVKDVTKYADELHKKHKTVKEEESNTLEAVQAMQTSTQAVQKSKDMYTHKAQELEKLRKDNGSGKDIEKAETKLRKLQDEYKALMEKHNPIKGEFEKKMSLTCKRFQEIEEAHLRQMKEFLSTYLELIQNNHDMVGQVHSDFKRQFLDMTVDKLLEQFVLNKYTGLEKPEIPELELISLAPTPNTSHTNKSITNTTSTPANNTNQQQQQQQSASQQTHPQLLIPLQSQTTNSGTPRAVSPEPTSSSTSVKSNFRNWFSTNIPVPGGGGAQASSSKQLNNTSAASASATANNSISGGNSMFDSNSSSTLSNIHPNDGVTTNGNSQQADIQGSYISPALSQLSEQNSSALSSNTPISGILRSRRDKKQTKKAAKKKKDADSLSNKEENIVVEEKEEPIKCDPSPIQSTSSMNQVPMGVAPTATPEVDEDGFSIQPRKNASWEEGRDKSSFYSDSDSDSDCEKPERKIHVEIKPLNNGSAPISASVDELRATVASLSPIGIYTHSSERQQIQNQNLNSLSQQQSPEQSNASTPTTSVHPYAPLQSPTPSVTNNSSRYADLGDIFSEIGDISLSAPTSATFGRASSRQIPTPTSGSSIAIPRPPSRRSEAAIRIGRTSPSNMSRADSVGSMEFRTHVVGIGSSRGPSPLTIGMNDSIPLAVAFHEIIHAYFRGSDESRCQVKMSGDMMLSFPAGIVNVLANNPHPAKLGFRIKNVQNLDKITPNNMLVQIDKLQSTSFSTMLEFNMPALTALLRRQFEQSPNASYFNVDILKYQIRSKPGASSCPFQLVSYWKCEPSHTALKIDYKYNCHAMSSSSPLLNVTISVPVDGGVKNVQAKPHSVWMGESNRLVWNFTDISQHSEGNGVGTLRARLEVSNGPSTPSVFNTQFNCEGTTLSGIEFELVGSGYRLSLVKRRFVSGKYICEGDGVRSTQTPTPLSMNSSSPYSTKSS